MNPWAVDISDEERIQAQILRRLKILRVANVHTFLRKRIMNQCAENPVGWINDWCWTYDPRNVERGLPAMVPFDLWPKQEELVEWIHGVASEGRSGVVEKSRDWGATWLFVACFVHRWLFAPGWSGGIGSRKKDLVDRLGDPDSIFEKVRILLRNLPPWMVPDGWHAKEMRLYNPDNGSTITGEVGDNIGRGGRKSWYFVDEGGFLARPQLVDSALSNTTNIQFWLSTVPPEGRSSLFARKRFSGQYPVFVCDWKDDPRKNQEWYDGKVAEFQYAPDIVSREIDRDYVSASDTQTIPGVWLQACVGLKLPEGTSTVAALDVADSGANWNVLVIKRGPLVMHVEAWKGMNTTETTWRAVERCKEWGVELLMYDSIGVGAGVTGTLQSAGTDSDGKLKVPFRFKGINSASKPSKRRYDEKPARDLFRNLRSELWWRVRRRVQYTWEHVQGHNGQTAPDQTRMISVPNNSELIAQLTLPTWRYMEAGKIAIEGKDKMASRGIASPDHADALVMAFYADSAHESDWLERMVGGAAKKAKVAKPVGIWGAL